MWIDWFVRCSKSIVKWPLRVVCDECKRHRYKLSFSPLLFMNHQRRTSLQLNPYDWKHHQRDDYSSHYRRFDQRKQSLFWASSIVGALTSAAVLFSWENDGISDGEL